MIHYTEKGAGLHDYLLRQGLPIRNRNGVWLAEGDEAATQAAMDAYTVADAAAYKIALLPAISEALRDAFFAANQYPRGEQITFSAKLAQAQAWVRSSDDADAPMLATEAHWRGLTTGALVQRVLDNAAVAQLVEGHISGAEGAHRAALRALTTFESVADYDIEAGWPAVS